MDIKEFMAKAAGNWVSTKNCNVGDDLLITSQPTMDTTSFTGKTYLTMDVTVQNRLDDKGQSIKLKLRLGGQQVQNLEPSFGDDGSKWVGRKIKIAAKQNYSGLGKEGFIYIPAN
jgi:hypothetical protein